MKRKVSIFDKGKIIAFIVFIALIVVVTVALTVTFCKGEEQLVTVYTL